MEKYSHEIDTLPVLDANNVLQFLQYFIKISQDPIWQVASFILQGTIRTTEAFLQEMLRNAVTTNLTQTSLILKSLNSLLEGKIKVPITTEENLYSTPYNRYIFYKLAIYGEVADVPDETTQFLVRLGISFSVEHEKSAFKLISCIEKARMLEYIFQEK